MTLHQLHYTSCEHGTEGIQGFQISAISAGADRELTELAVRTSTYEIGPEYASAAADALDAVPATFGYVPVGGRGVLFLSTYTGADYTGRMGNYFAHAIMSDDIDRDLGGALPVDLWRSPLWVSEHAGGDQVLPAVPRLVAGAADPPSASGDLLARVVSAVQAVLTTGRGRVIVVVDAPGAAVPLLATITRSLPRSLALRVSFLSYSARPERQEVTICATTRGTRLPTYGDFVVVDATGGTGDQVPVTAFAETVRSRWEGRGERGLAELAELAERVSPPLAAAELDTFAVVADLGARGRVDGITEPELLASVTMALTRLPKGVFGEQAWSVVASRAGSVGMSDVAGWAAVLRDQPHAPRSLLLAYYAAALGSADGTWLPALAPRELGEVVHEILVPKVIDGLDLPGDVLARRPEIVDALVDALAAELTRPGVAHRVYAGMTKRTAQVISAAGSGSPAVRAATAVALARHGEADPVDVLAGFGRELGPDAEPVARLLWPNGLTIKDAVRTVRGLNPALLAGSGLSAQAVALVVAAVRTGKLDSEITRLAGELAGQPHLDGDTAAALDAVKLIAAVDRVTAKQAEATPIQSAIAVARRVDRDLARLVTDAVASALVRLQPNPAFGIILGDALRTGGDSLRTAYEGHAVKALAKMNPTAVANAVHAWATLADSTTRRQLVEHTLPKAVGKRGRRDLDRIGVALLGAARGSQPPSRSTSWQSWWKNWRRKHEHVSIWRSLFGRKK
ncbi:GTPase-associated protein 1-related protein [Actinokineospora cianjurensis]|uniref:Uncharacterized protein n=1 Tax=Actinokineospora cianjurensis TaxID=585224 RepID=A0A421AWS6_9PSEU|nr:GTPase-associated protein 1-related protein [Actinokineospora cianjurensis]RLK54187.1 hypothetical protein CLV68_6190 [Actinokineospora cianjurensis]